MKQDNSAAKAAFLAYLEENPHYGSPQEAGHLRAQLTSIREAAGPEVRDLSHWLSTVPTAVDSEYSRRADALRALLREIDGEAT